MLTPQEFEDLVRRMRTAQVGFFKSKGQEIHAAFYKESRRLEAQVDTHLAGGGQQQMEVEE